MKALEEMDIKFSNKVVNLARKFEDYTAIRNEQGAARCKSEQMVSIIESLKRISEYSADIAEMSINMSSERDRGK